MWFDARLEEIDIWWPPGLVGLPLILTWVPYTFGSLRKTHEGANGLWDAVRSVWGSGNRAERAALAVAAFRLTGCTLIGLLLILAAFGVTPISDLILAGFGFLVITVWPFRKVIEKLLR